ncbi:MAG: HEAT repeat domain-containing protein [Candidatus Micrarchaeia archaeon]
MQDQNIQRLISLTFDENPKVRKEAAKSLAEIDDPAALFAIMELSYDKDPSVKKIARDMMNKKKSSEREVMSFAEIFSAPTVKLPEPNEVPETNEEEKRRRILVPIEQLFERKLGKQRADAVRGKMMPTIEKIYSKVVNVKPSEAAHTGKSAIQEFLTSYLEAISDIDALASEGSNQETTVQRSILDKAADLLPQKRMPEPSNRSELLREEKTMDDQEEVQATLEVMGSRQGDAKEAAEEMRKLESEEIDEEQDPTAKLPSTFLKRAYETMMLTEGDEELMKREMRRMVKDVERDLKLAFQAAMKKYKETNLAHLTKLKSGMGLVNTEILLVKSVEKLSHNYKKGEVTYYRIIVSDDEQNEGVVYLMDRNGDWIRAGMNIKVLKGRVKSFDFSGETAISVSGNKGNIYIVV